MIITNTPQKEYVESCQKNTKVKRRLKNKRTRRHLPASGNSDDKEAVQVHFSDHS